MRPIASLAVLALAVCAAPAYAHEGNPNMESKIRSLTPATKGVTLDVLNRDDRFELVNRSEREIVIEGYESEPYARLRRDGTVEVNTRSPAYYLNDDRYAQVDVPDSADSKASPAWKRLSGDGRFQWHDHRMHYMGKGVPPQVKDRARRQKVFDYEIPITIGGRDGEITGTLLWIPQKDGGPPIVAIVALIAIVGAAAAFVATVRRRRGGSGEAW